MQVGDVFEVGMTRMRVEAIERGRMRFVPEASGYPVYSASGADMAAIVRAHMKRLRKRGKR